MARNRPRHVGDLVRLRAPYGTLPLGKTGTIVVVGLVGPSVSVQFHHHGRGTRPSVYQVPSRLLRTVQPCPRQPPPYGEAHPRARWSTAEVRTIRALAARGVPNAVIAQRFQAHRNYIGLLVSGRRRPRG